MTAIQRLQLGDDVLVLSQELPVHGAGIMLIVVDAIVGVLVTCLRAIGSRRIVTLVVCIFLKVIHSSVLFGMKKESRILGKT